MYKFLDYYSDKTGINLNLLTALLVSSVFCVAMVFYRVKISGSLLYGFLGWNLFLAWLPYIFSLILTSIKNLNRAKILAASVFFAWLIFLPNSQYIITDLFHLQQRPNIPLWFDLVLLTAFAWNGFILGILSLYEIQKFINANFGKLVSWFIIVLSIIASGFGIYLGRFLRWNSWDFITNPVLLWADIFARISNPFAHPGTFGFTLFFSCFLLTTYLTLFCILIPQKNK